ncbi:hypothetical protein [Rhizobium sp. PL01]|uniref:hypothetical protein n=1 Tax=Rhizobium sp. PL01 TaxID=3085631 RepID=UPI002982A72A|nr:hypothetical protein [Rhizobium sp. PL01]MDW5315982.1 hypothetical protein [Rhizobium sp. PL01]
MNFRIRMGCPDHGGSDRCVGRDDRYCTILGQAAQTVGSSACREGLKPCVAAIRVKQKSGAIQTLFRHRETMVSRNSFRFKRRQHIGPRCADTANAADDAIVDQALALYGSAAATAIAYCAIDAWFEDEKDEFNRFAAMFRRLRN